MEAVAGDEERVEALSRARSFKRSWIELAEALVVIAEKKSHERWGYKSFEMYCKMELKLTPATAMKLVGSFRFLRQNEPRVIERVRRDPSAEVPSMKAVDFVARATERGAADATALKEIRRAAFEEGAEAPALSKRFKTVAFPVEEADPSRQRAQILSTGRRLAQLVAESEELLPKQVAIAVETAIGELLSCLEETRAQAA